MSQNVQIRGAGGAVADVDPGSGGLAVIDAIHQRIHLGQLYSASLIDAALDAAASLEMLVRVPEGVTAHLRIGADSLNSCRLGLFEGTTLNAGEDPEGTPIVPVNRNRLSDNEADTELYSGPDVDADGATLFDRVVSWSTFGASPFEEFVLPEGDYLVRATNVDGSAQPVSLMLDFYEEEV
ncbi:hypothetical protein ELZ19_06745 [Brucella abortus]|uniref:hypothetical protein n=1 Tax=Brucella abortus TaxID=235 RepID=UPI0004E8E895|nr:hypothetical protein [Brucella abortus]KFH18423.1 hypothetical protein IB60_17085 [Brucella abortus LMN1]RUQ67347.1 hypothetical protein ELZ23_15580 [Brucella abortus]RUQ78149.1 hypothetical protein ELZ22_17295 [Brucella abortus]RUQ88266.1 hypothetical protein ELZ18_15500 [Brucella abortus]RUQ90295.1 hypothetical protein ELZ20_15495 [Brucella abortus]